MKRSGFKPRTKPMTRGRMIGHGPVSAFIPLERRDAFLTLDPADPGDGTHKPRHVTEQFRYSAPQLAALFRPAPKDNPLQHEGYMAQVRRLPCIKCGVVGFTQFAHADIIGAGGKGKGIKSDCRLGYPACGPRPAVGNPAILYEGCHSWIGSSGNMFKAARHAFEEEAGRTTRLTIINMGRWPEKLPRWKDE